MRDSNNKTFTLSIIIILFLLLTITFTFAAEQDLDIRFPEDNGIYELNDLGYQENINRYFFQTRIVTSENVSKYTYEITNADTGYTTSSRLLPEEIEPGLHDVDILENGFIGGNWIITVIALSENNTELDRDSVHFSLELLTHQKIDLINYVLPEIIETIETITSPETIIDSISQYLDITTNIIDGVYKAALEKVTVTKQAEIVQIGLENYTRVNIEIDPQEELTDVVIIEYIPKELVESAKQEISTIDLPEGVEFEIIEDDPLMMWHFKEVDKKVNLKYQIKKEVDLKELEKSKTIILAEEALKMYKQKNAILDFIGNNLIAVILIPIVAVILIYIFRIMPKKENPNDFVEIKPPEDYKEEDEDKDTVNKDLSENDDDEFV